MNLKTIPSEVWQRLRNVALKAKRNGRSVRRVVDNTFYQHIYSQWGKGKVNYTHNIDTKMDPGWETLVREWNIIQDTGRSMGKVIKDHSIGYAGVQKDSGWSDEALRMARLWEHYNDNIMQDRFQFVVNMGGGMVLFNRMRRACQTYIIEQLQRDPRKFVVSGWKVFGESAAIGRCDSCVVYLTCKYDDPKLKNFINTYLVKHIKDLWDTNFIPLGMYQIGSYPLWAMRMPRPGKEWQVLGEKSGGSAGGLMSAIIGEAFERAIHAADQSGRELYLFEIKKEAQKIVNQLYL